MDPRTQAYAHILVDCIDPKPNWQVLVRSQPPGRSLVEEITRELGRRGARPLVRLNFDSAGGTFVREAPMELLTTLSDGAFDWIIIDTPPVLDAIDAVILAPSVTGFVYVARADVTRRRLAARALKTILAAGAGSVAVVLNRVDGSRSLVGRR